MEQDGACLRAPIFRKWHISHDRLKVSGHFDHQALGLKPKPILHQARYTVFGMRDARDADIGRTPGFCQREPGSLRGQSRLHTWRSHEPFREAAIAGDGAGERAIELTVIIGPIALDDGPQLPDIEVTIA